MSILNTTLTNLNNLINNYLNLDPHSKDLLKKWSNKTLRIKLLGTPGDFLFYTKNQQLLIKPFANDHCDATIIGPPFSLINIMLSKNKISSSKIEIMGNLSSIENFNKLISSIEIDWEEQLTKLIGDTSGVALYQTAQTTATWLKNIHSSFWQNLTEVTQEEVQLYPPRTACEHHYDLIDELHLDTARLEQQISILESTIILKQSKHQ